MTEDERKEQLINMHLCLDIAANIMTMLGEQEDKASGGSYVEVHIDTIIVEVNKHFHAPLVRKRKDALGEAIAGSINQYGPTSCAVWSIAHMLEHILYEEDVSKFP